jgi:hypothetical protein
MSVAARVDRDHFERPSDALLQGVLEAWTATMRLQRQPGYEAVIQTDDEQERIGKGTHERFVVDMQRFMRRIATKGR